MHGILCYVPKITAGMLGVSMAATATPLEGPLQYGALGLCALMCFGVYKILKDHATERGSLVVELRAKDAQFIKVMSETNETLQALTEALKTVPGIKEDGEKKGGGGS